MKLFTNVPEFYNDLSETIRAFRQEDEILLCDEADAELSLTQTVVDGLVTAAARANGASAENCCTLCGDETEQKRALRRNAKMAVYRLLKKTENITLPWGSLTGIRPTKLFREYPSEEALLRLYDLPVEKGRLLREIVERQAPFFQTEPEETDVYIGIPFCRTRCIYCSFSATDATKGRKVMVPYVDALLEEMEDTARLLKETGRRVRCLYIGGGTPTALDEELFSKMLCAAAALFTPQREFTVEAGRPDTITMAKLQEMQRQNVDRISINPQTMNDRTLAMIGRAHTAGEIVDCFALARNFGFCTINADLIAGLPGETPEDFTQTLNSILALHPENITVHTLALKRGSIMTEKGYRLTQAEDVQTMVETARETLGRHGYHPYYLYRQKYMTGNLENIGYCLPGHEGIYNIDIMEETTDIAALGAGSASKRIFREENRIERTFDIKNINEYIARRDDRLSRKRVLFGGSV